MPREVSCPRCGRRHEWEGNPYRPFCSERCKMVDLGRWLSGDYRVPVRQDPDTGAFDVPVETPEDPEKT